MKDGLDRRGKKNRLENGKNCMHWNVPPDALPGSATLVYVWTAGLWTGWWWMWMCQQSACFFKQVVLPGRSISKWLCKEMNF